MQCPSCFTEYVAEDLYCRQCGEDLAKPSTHLVPLQKNLPAVLYQSPLSRRVAAGVGALALGVGIELLRRSVLTRLAEPSTIDSALPAITGLKDILLPQQNKPAKPPKGYQVEETIVYLRRVTRRTN